MHLDEPNVAVCVHQQQHRPMLLRYKDTSDSIRLQHMFKEGLQCCDLNYPSESNNVQTIQRISFVLILWKKVEKIFGMH